MNKIIAALTVTVALFTAAPASAACGKKQTCGAPPPTVCETVRIDPALWKKVQDKYWEKGQYAYWQARALVCQGDCPTFGGKNRGPKARICAPRGMQVCYQDSLTGQKHIWTIDGNEE